MGFRCVKDINQIINEKKKIYNSNSTNTEVFQQKVNKTIGFIEKGLSCLNFVMKALKAF